MYFRAQNITEDDYERDGCDEDFFMAVTLAEMSNANPNPSKEYSTPNRPTGLPLQVTPNPTGGECLFSTVVNVPASTSNVAAMPRNIPSEENFSSSAFTTHYFNDAIEKIEREEILGLFDPDKLSEMEEWTSNTKHYETAKMNTFKRWLRTIAEHGGKELRKLGGLQVEDRFGKQNPLLIAYLSGERTKHKYKVLDKLLQFIPLFWKKKNGDPYEPGSFRLYIKHINAILKGEGVNYSIENEFSNKGEFHAVLNNILKKIVKKTKTMAKKANKLLWTKSR